MLHRFYYLPLHKYVQTFPTNHIIDGAYVFQHFPIKTVLIVCNAITYVL